MKKIMILSLILLFTTGCSVDYNLQFKDKVLSEHMVIDASDTDVTKDQLEKMIDEYIPNNAENGQEYQIKQKNKKIQLSTRYSTETYKNSLLLNQCYTAYNFIESDHYYDLTTSSTFSCNPFDYMYIDELKIKIKTNHKVISHNADSVENNTYIWNITTENAENKPIQIRFSKETKKDNIGLIILGITVIIAIIILLVVCMQKKNNNKI